jgi:hypothetical protein
VAYAGAHRFLDGRGSIGGDHLGLAPLRRVEPSGHHLAAQSAVTYKEVAARPEGHLVYPNSKLWYPLGSDENTSGFNSSQGKAGAMLLSEDSTDQIYAWYRDWLLAAGWHLTYSGPGTTGAWKTCDKYRRGSRERFTVAVDDPALLGVLLGGKVPKARDILEVRYTIVPYSYIK